MHDNGYQTITISEWYALNGVFSLPNIAAPAPIANFTANVTVGKPPLAVQFTDTSAGTGISAWSWDFNNDGTVDSILQNPQITLTNEGSYNVSLTVTNAAGSDQEVKTDLITVTATPIAPIANFTANVTAGNPPLAVQFTDTSAGTGISAWSWDFNNDGTVDSILQNPQITLTNEGSYNVSLTVTNAAGSDQEVKSDLITVTATPIAPNSSVYY